MHIALSGNIGAGKTTLVEKLASHFDWEPCFESVDDNPYLQDFYKDMQRWAFHLQIYFLNHRFNQVLFAQKNDKTTILDRSLYEDAYIFALTLQEEGKMSSRDYQNYLKLFESVKGLIPAPDLLIYLRANVPKLKEHIQKRGRAFEANIPDAYLEHLNFHYENWIKNYQEGELLIVDINQKDFLNNTSHFSELTRQIEQSLQVYM